MAKDLIDSLPPSMISQMNAANSTFSERMSSCPIRALATETAGSSFWKLDGDWGLREKTVMAKLPADGTANLERKNSGYLGGGAPPQFQFPGTATRRS